MFQNHEKGQEIVLITASSSPSADFDQILQTYRDRLIAVHVISIGWQTFETLFDLARYGRHYIVPSNFDDVMDNSRTSRTWMVDTLYSIDSQARKYRAKVDTSVRKMNTRVNPL